MDYRATRTLFQRKKLIFVLVLFVFCTENITGKITLIKLKKSTLRWKQLVNCTRYTIYICFVLSLSMHSNRLIRKLLLVGFTTTYAISAYHHKRCEFECRLWRDVPDATLCDKFGSDLWQVGDFLRVLRFPPPIKLVATI